MPKIHKIYILCGLLFILLVTTSIALIPYFGTLFGQSKPISPARTPEAIRPMPAQAPIIVNKTKPPANRFDLNSEAGKFEYQINQLLMAKNFREIDRIAREIRKTKKRFINGKWAIHRLYMGLTTIYATDSEQFETDELWLNRIEIIKSWKKQFPDSVTAVIALARTYSKYGWFARGDGYSNTVSEENFQLLEERLNLASNELLDAVSLKEKCPEWYYVKLYIAMTVGVPNRVFDAIFEEAIKFEPNYYTFYSVKSQNLRPRWGGSQAEWQEFVDSIPDIMAQHNSDEGNMTYLLVAVEASRDSSVIGNYKVFSKARIRQGFEFISKKHGADNSLLNEYAYLSIMVQDITAAKKAMEKIGDDPDPSVWSKQLYYGFKEHIENGMLTDDQATGSF